MANCFDVFLFLAFFGRMILLLLWLTILRFARGQKFRLSNHSSL